MERRLGSAEKVVERKERKDMILPSRLVSRGKYLLFCISDLSRKNRAFVRTSRRYPSLKLVLREEATLFSSEKLWTNFVEII